MLLKSLDIQEVQDVAAPRWTVPTPKGSAMAAVDMSERIAKLIDNLVDRTTDHSWDCVLATLPSIALVTNFLPKTPPSERFWEAYRAARALAEAGQHVDSDPFEAWNEAEPISPMLIS